MYNSADDLVADGMDALEKLLIDMLPELIPGQKRTKGKATAVDSKLVAEVKKVGALTSILNRSFTSRCASYVCMQGTDAVTECLQETHQLPGDKFEVYCLINIFKIPEKYHDKIRSKLVS